MSSSRRYDSTRRADAARETQRRIIAAARHELLERGYQATTLAALAGRASVSQQTIYNSVGSKAAVLKAVYDVQLAGDDEPIAMNARPEFHAVMSQRSVPATLRAYAAMSRMIIGRVGPLLGAVFVDGAGSDAELRAFLATIDRERRAGNTGVVTHIRDRFGLPEGLSLQRAVDAIWTLTAPEVADRLVRRCGWSLDDYETWLANALISGFRTRH
ncbi:MAG: TetR/AcrR family transcriptional regulator [Actinomycetota bacterium]|nr:TetR/AcrR family transcriptional regulator [Actinomycetota bacterium]